MTRLQEGDTIVVAFLNRLSRNFEDGVRIQGEVTRRNIGIVAIRENIYTREGSAAAKFFRRSMLAQGAYQVNSASERIRLSHEQAEQCRRIAGEGAGLRHIGRVMNCSPATVKMVLAPSERSAGLPLNSASTLSN